MRQVDSSLVDPRSFIQFEEELEDRLSEPAEANIAAMSSVWRSGLPGMA
jgi:hypothetical protein